MNTCLFLLIAALSSAIAFENKSIGEFCENRLQNAIFIRSAGLEDYLRTKNENGELQKEFKSIGSGQLFIGDESVREENKAKNRNEKYIVTQLPMKNTANDFWQMVWENNVYTLVLITKLNEKGKDKLYKYWPKDASRFGKIEVILEKSDYLTDYVIRTFTMSYDKKKRLVKQYHLLDWNDDKLPIPEIFLKFVNEVREQGDYKPSRPVVVHCSTGSGPLCTFVLIDSALHAYRESYKMDFSRHLCSMRLKRMNVVESFSQFELAIKVVVTSINKIREEAKA